MSGVGLALPADHEALGHGGRLIDAALGHSGLVDPASGLRDVGQRHHRGAGQVVAGGAVVDVEYRLIPPDRSEHRQACLHVDADVTGVDGQGERLGRWQAAAEFPVDQQRPHIAEGDALCNQFLDVDSAVTQCAAVLVGLGDVGGEGDHTFETGNEIFGNVLNSHGLWTPSSRLRPALRRIRACLRKP
ncbi:unannotated protein [freshwater metagenome]|uniref:Unannotated protein n=1 Tax=freshwater metagenome TaxID=449393 RepID=A0A6J7FB49_9ZZZZ